MDGNSDIIYAEDGSTLLKPRFQLVSCDKNEIDQLQQGTTLGKNQGVLKKIISKAGKNHYNVIFVGKDGKDFHDKVPSSFLRDRLNLTRNITIT